MAQDLMTADKPFTIPLPPEDTRTSLVSNVLAIVGFIIVIVIVIWGLVHLAGISRNWFGSFFGTSGETLEVSAPETATSGEAFDIIWNYEPSDPGTYAFLYQCASGLQFRTDVTEIPSVIPCGAAYTIPADDNTFSLTPFLSGTSSLSVPLSVIFLPSATGTQAQGSASILIAPKVSVPVTPPPAAAPTPSPAPQPPQTQAPTQTSSKGKKYPPDLSVRIISIVPDSLGMTTVTFDIANVGGAATGVYYFTASLPTTSGYTYTSPAQVSLASGDVYV